ncbi:hypothetical protein JL721_3303 [Aureococcus anophagefferens]|nr:hypothetical protein JL721_3303 [Aureococcus anophagefferens]
MEGERTVRLRASVSNDSIMTVEDAREEEPNDDDPLRRRQRRRRPRRARVFLAVAFVVLCGGASYAAVACRSRALRVAERIGALPPLEADAAYVALLAVWLLCLLPTSVLEVAAGFILGFWRAALCSTLGKFLGSESGYLRGLELALQREPFGTCLALRLAYVPEAVQNYVPAVFDAPFVAFAAATLVGSSLYALLWAKLGSQLSSASDVGADGMSPEKVLFMCPGAGLAAVFGLAHWNSKRVIARWNALEVVADAGRDGALAPKPPAGYAAAPHATAVVYAVVRGMKIHGRLWHWWRRALAAREVEERVPRGGLRRVHEHADAHGRRRRGRRRRRGVRRVRDDVDGDLEVEVERRRVRERGPEQVHSLALPLADDDRDGAGAAVRAERRFERRDDGRVVGDVRADEHVRAKAVA